MSETLLISNGNVIELQGLKNTATNVTDTGATVTVTVKDSAGVNVSGETWPVTMPHAASGTYRATLSDSMALTALRQYTAYVEATGSGGEVGHWECTLTARARGCS